MALSLHETVVLPLDNDDPPKEDEVTSCDEVAIDVAPCSCADEVVSGSDDLMGIDDAVAVSSSDIVVSSVDACDEVIPADDEVASPENEVSGIVVVTSCSCTVVSSDDETAPCGDVMTASEKVISGVIVSDKGVDVSSPDKVF